MGKGVDGRKVGWMDREDVERNGVWMRERKEERKNIARFNSVMKIVYQAKNLLQEEELLDDWLMSATSENRVEK